MGIPSSLLLPIFLLSLYHHALGFATADPTDGFTLLPLSNSNFEIQRPYNIPVDQRYTFIDGVHRFRVYSNDAPHYQGSDTKPRTEIRIKGYDYSSGVWQFEGNVYVPTGTSGVCVMQVFGGSTTATTLQLRVYDGALKYYRGEVIVPNFYNKWVRVNVIHNVGAGKVTIFIDGVEKLEVNDRGGSSHYFKVGVYAQDSSSNYMESRWRGLKVFKK